MSACLSIALVASVLVMVACVTASVREHRRLMREHRRLMRRLRVRRGPVLRGVGLALRRSMERGEILN